MAKTFVSNFSQATHFFKMFEAEIGVVYSIKTNNSK